MADTANAAGTITVRCRLVGELRTYLPDGDRGEGPVAVPAGSTVDDLLVQLDLPEREALVVGLNGTQTSRDAALSEGDELTIVAAMTGG